MNQLLDKYSVILSEVSRSSIARDEAEGPAVSPQQMQGHKEIGKFAGSTVPSAPKQQQALNHHPAVTKAKTSDAAAKLSPDNRAYTIHNCCR
ncbi:MAG TPA: hypothetical protein VGU46_11040 [Acidobacteriaceae bacterium]|nr:hypothetical protein [Acidobacteriaceae bacterium]